MSDTLHIYQPLLNLALATYQYQMFHTTISLFLFVGKGFEVTHGRGVMSG